MKNVTVQHIPIKEEKFYILWLSVLNIFNKLRNKELIILAKFLEYHYKLSKTIKDEEYLNQILFSTKTRKLIMTELDISEHILNNALASLRKKKLITGNSIKKNLIPKYNDKLKKFNLLFAIDVI